MSFKVGHNKLLKKYNEIWEKISYLMNIEFDSEPVYGDGEKYIKRKIKMYEDRANTNFKKGKKVPKGNTSYKCLSLIMLDSVIRVNKKNYPQTLLEWKYVIRKNKIENLINDDLNESDNENDNESDNESDSEFDSESDN